MKRMLRALALRAAVLITVSTLAQAQEAAPAAPESAGSQAAPAVRLSSRERRAQLAVALEPVALAPNAKVDPDMEADCKFEDALGADVGKNRYNVGANPFRGTCHVFHQHTKRLGKDLASWIKDVSYKVDNPMLDGNDDTDADTDVATIADLAASAAAH